MAKATKKPTGLKITRKGNRFTFSWTCGDDNYQGGQELWYNYGTGWISKSGLTAGARSTYVDLTDAKLISGKKKKVDGANHHYVAFKVRGKRKNTRKHKYDWSETPDHYFYFKNPAGATGVTLTTTADGTNYRTTLSWNAAPNPQDTGAKFLQWEVQTVLTTVNYKKFEEVVGWGSKIILGAGRTSYPWTEEIGIENTNKWRYVKIHAKGIDGETAWVYRKISYSKPNATESSKTLGEEVGGKTKVTLSWKNVNEGGNHPYDSTKVQYVVITPGDLLSFPQEEQVDWTTYRTYLGTNNGSKEIVMELNHLIANNKVMFIQYETTHNNETTVSVPVLVKKVDDRPLGRITAASDVSVVATAANHTVTVSATNTCDIDDSYIVVRFYESEQVWYDIGIIQTAAQQEESTFNCPAWTGNKYKFSIRTVIGTNTSETVDGVTYYTINELMSTSEQFFSGSMPLQPEGVAVVPHRKGTVKVVWEWSWDEATAAELSWSDNIDSWESTDEPSTYVVTKAHNPMWYISELDAGKRWYFRVRLMKGNDDNAEYSAYSEQKYVDLSSAPATPTLTVTPSFVTSDGVFTCAWGYVSTDGTKQAGAEICELTYSYGTPVYTPLMQVTTEQRVDIHPEEFGWEAGTSHDLVVRTLSDSGQQSEDWSAKATISIVPNVQASITGTSLVNVAGQGELPEYELKQMPMTVDVSGAGNDKKVSVSIVRTVTRPYARPDDSEVEGFAGETVALISRTGDGQVSFSYPKDILLYLDEKADYRLDATISDAYGQSDTASVPFVVNWEHQAVRPDATIVVEDDVAKITINSVEGLAETDTFDIYRLTTDKPILIFSGAIVGGTYVDPYPTVGEHGGYRIVTKTETGDYTTSDYDIAWQDYNLDEDNYTPFEYEGTIINFGGGEVRLKYNIDVDHSWAKDFQRTRYLGGSIQGDHNVGVERDGSVSFVALPLIEEDLVAVMRDLAEYTGVCLVRTKDGSTLVADVQVSESNNHSKRGQVVNFSLDVSAVDPNGYQAVTLSEWTAGQEA